MNIKSDGLMGAAITLIKTSPSAGLGIGTSTTLNLFGPSNMSAFIIVGAQLFMSISIKIYLRIQIMWYNMINCTSSILQQQGLTEGFMIINHSHRRMNDLDNFLIKNNAQPTPRRSTSQRALFHADGATVTQMPLINKENTYCSNVSPGRGSRKPMISPKKSDRSCTNQTQNRHSQQVQQWRPHTIESSVNSVMSAVCGNHENKSAEFQIVIDEETMFYCQKCAAKLASQGFPVKKILLKSQNKSLKEKDSSKNIPCMPQYAGNPFYEELISILKNINSVEDTKQQNIVRCQSLAEHFESQKEKILSIHQKFHEMVELSKNQQISHLSSQQQKYNQICVIQKDHIEEESNEMSRMKEDIQSNMETIVIEVQNDEESFSECVQTYKSKLEIFRHKLEEQMEMLSSVKETTYEEMQEKLSSFNTFICSLWEEKRRSRTQSSMQQKPFKANKEQSPIDSYEISKGPFRNLFESECQQQVQFPQHRQLHQRRNGINGIMI